MSDFPLNQIIKSETSWICNVFEFDRINAGGLYLSFQDFEFMDVEPFTEQNFRLYRKTKKIVLSSGGQIDYNFCALRLRYDYWKCLLCQKLSKISESKCYCLTYSNCWSPIDGVITGASFSNELLFLYHFEENAFSNLIL